MSAANEHLAGLSPLKQAVLELRDLRGRLDELTRAQREPVAIIGLGCRFPGGANDPESYWRLLRDGVDAITEVPAERRALAAWDDPALQQAENAPARFGGFIDEVDRFDADFFGIAPREAVSMDPQQRLLLEVAWEALEHAGQAPDRLARSRTGVFIGMATFDYSRLQAQLADPEPLDAYFGTGLTHCVAAGRISYLLGLQGPSMAIDTACSSSLVAVHLACQSLRQQECRLALAGGVNLMLSPDPTVAFCRAQMLAADGRCKTFAADADGYVRAEGCGIVVLKRLSDAEADGDNILAVIRGSAVNQDGRSSGLTAPNGPAQEAVVRAALSAAGVAPHEVQFVETHGTGTALGDPIELRALAAALAPGRAASAPVILGSAKANIGHTESAAGVAGLTKLVLALGAEEIPAQLHASVLNPLLPWDELPLRVPTQNVPWPADRGERIGTVSALGFSGTNAHLVISSAPPRKSKSAAIERPRQLLTLSARNEAALVDQARRLAEWLQGHRAVPLADVAHSANTGRSQFAYRLALVGTTSAEIAEQLQSFATEPRTGNDDKLAHGLAMTAPGIAFLFTGQGAQYPGMARQLFDTQPTFRRTIEQCDAWLQGSLEPSLVDVLYGSQTALLEQTAYAQPAMFAVEYALAELWRSWGIEPAAVMGHSLGEYVAACVAGVLEPADAIRLVAARGRLMQDLPAVGAMAAVFTSADRLQPLLQKHSGALHLAAVNGPESVVVSGPAAAIDKFLAELSEQGVRSKRLEVAHAFHSPAVEPMLDSLAAAAAGIEFRAPRIPLISNVTGRFFGPDEIPTADYWTRHARQTTQFAAGIRALHAAPCRAFVEIGPHNTLIGMAGAFMNDADCAWLPSLRSGHDDWRQMLETLSRLYVTGAAVDWQAFDADYRRRKVSLPTYPFQRERFWWAGTAQAAGGNPAKLGEQWQHVVAAARRQSGQLPITLRLDTYEEKWAATNDLATAYMVRTLRQFEAFAQPGENYTVDEFLTAFGIIPGYKKLISRWFHNLAARGVLRESAGEFTGAAPLDSAVGADAMFDTALARAELALADTPFLLEYMQHCGALLARVLRGQESALETLFPGGSFHIAEFLYHQWDVARYFNNIVAAAVESRMATQAAARPLRILEVGAGSGGTSSAVFPVLPVGRAEYCYTDVSEVFFPRAQERFRRYPGIHYRTLDIERDPAEQGYQPHSYDVIVAANVLHATHNLGETIDHVRDLLAPGGILALYETTSHPSWFDISVGLIEGWHRFDDPLRKDNPLLPAKAWKKILLDRGFIDAAEFPEPATPGEILAQHVILARAPHEGVSAARSSDSWTERDGGMADPSATETPADSIVPDTTAFLSELRTAPPHEARELLLAYVRRNINRVMGRDISKPILRQQRLMDLGIDSLMAVGLRNLLSVGLQLGRSLPATLVFDYPTVDAVAVYLAEQLVADGVLADDHETAAADNGQVEIVPACTTTVATPEDIADLSDAEVERMLLEKYGAAEEEVR